MNDINEVFDLLKEKGYSCTFTSSHTGTNGYSHKNNNVKVEISGYGNVTIRLDIKYIESKTLLNLNKKNLTNTFALCLAQYEILDALYYEN